MKDIVFVSADELSTLEDYAASLVSGLITLNSLGRFHVVADKKGLLTEDEMELCQTIHYELNRLKAVYQTQMNNILERTEITAEEIYIRLQSMVPKKKTNKKDSLDAKNK
jgi:hypothetical protein